MRRGTFRLERGAATVLVVTPLGPADLVTEAAGHADIGILALGHVQDIVEQDPAGRE